MANYPLEFGWHTDQRPKFDDPPVFTAVMPTLLGGADPDGFPKAEASGDAPSAVVGNPLPTAASRTGEMAPNSEPPPGRPKDETASDQASNPAPQPRWEDLSFRDRFAVANQRRQHQDNAHGGALNFISVARRRARFNEIQQKQQNGEALDYAEKRFLHSQRNVESELQAATDRIAKAQSGLKALPQSEKPGELHEKDSPSDRFGDTVSTFAAEQLPDLLLNLGAGKALGPAGPVVLAGVGGTKAYKSGILEALEGEGVDTTDAAALAKAADDPKLIERVDAKAMATALAAIIPTGGPGPRKDQKNKPAAKAREEAKKVQKAASPPTSESPNPSSVPERTNYEVFESIYQRPAEGPRSGHRVKANRRFRDELSENPEFSNAINELFGKNVLEHMNSGKDNWRPLNPPETEWHHHKPLDLRLLRKEEHRDRRLQKLLHPDGKGGE